MQPKEYPTNIQQETQLYAPIKQWFEHQGYTVRSEVHACDLVACHPDQPCPTIVELKKSFTLSLVLQAVERLPLSPLVYIAAPALRSHTLSMASLHTLCVRLGIGLFTVTFFPRKPPHVECYCTPLEALQRPMASRRLPRKTQKLLQEFQQRSGDFSIGGQRASHLQVTAYREKALKCAYVLHTLGDCSPKRIRHIVRSTAVSGILRNNVYGWFERISRGVYRLSPVGTQALHTYHMVIDAFLPQLLWTDEHAPAKK